MRPWSGQICQISAPDARATCAGGRASPVHAENREGEHGRTRERVREGAAIAEGTRNRIKRTGNRRQVSCLRMGSETAGEPAKGASEGLRTPRISSPDVIRLLVPREGGKRTRRCARARTRESGATGLVRRHPQVTGPTEGTPGSGTVTVARVSRDFPYSAGRPEIGALETRNPGEEARPRHRTAHTSILQAVWECT